MSEEIATIDAVVCLSGGLDSCVTLAEALTRHSRVGALHLVYGQRTAARERRAFEEICDHYDIEERLIAEQPALHAMGRSALTDSSIEVPTGEPGEGVPITYVPFRNGQILAVACAWAEATGAVEVYLGAVQEDSSGYPDCREEFFESFERAVDAGTRPETKIELCTPVLHLDKADIVRRGEELGAPLHLSWSCYQSSDVACGECESCHLRRSGFRRAGREDPISYLQ
jgi:7-cyano-7-deazaguanine synthase